VFTFRFRYRQIVIDIDFSWIMYIGRRLDELAMGVVTPDIEMMIGGD
jgi:hypothetical protein